MKAESASLQAEVPDQWADYQAKGIKSAIQEAAESAWLSVGKPPPPKFEEKRQRYSREQSDIQTLAREKERERDSRSERADHLLHQHHRFANSVALFQVAIALGAVAALTRVQSIWYGSILVGNCRCRALSRHSCLICTPDFLTQISITITAAYTSASTASRCRLTRSLPDFTKIVEISDAQHVSFVAVTQQFNTTTSMGRLTLNVLLSFAQFEREVTGERIRDKIAASKRKGIWMGGYPPVPTENLESC